LTEADPGYRSVPRNPLLSATLHRMNLVERIGSGIQRIRGPCREYGLETPEIEASGSWVTVTFPRRADRDGRGIGARGPDRIAKYRRPRYRATRYDGSRANSRILAHKSPHK